MAFLECKFHSEVLSMQREMYVILPQKTVSQIGLEGKAAPAGGAKVLYLLHGLSDDHTIWMRRTSIERYAAEYGIIVVMPSTDRGYYTNMKYGPRYYDFFADELPVIVSQFFHVSQKREDTFIAGLSMGGYGSYRLALTHPERFAGAASFSGAFDPVEVFSTRPPCQLAYTFGSAEEFKDSEGDLNRLARELASSGKQAPRFFMECGTEDSLYGTNQHFRKLFNELHFDLTYQERTGNHNWGFWDVAIRHALAWMFPK